MRPGLLVSPPTLSFSSTEGGKGDRQTCLGMDKPMFVLSSLPPQIHSTKCLFWKVKSKNKQKKKHKKTPPNKQKNPHRIMNLNPLCNEDRIFNLSYLRVNNLVGFGWLFSKSVLSRISFPWFAPVVEAGLSKSTYGVFYLSLSIIVTFTCLTHRQHP